MAILYSKDSILISFRVTKTRDLNPSSQNRKDYKSHLLTSERRSHLTNTEKFYDHMFRSCSVTQNEMRIYYHCCTVTILFEINFYATCCRLRRGATVAFSVGAAAEGAADGNANPAAAAPLRATTENGVPGDDGVPSPYPSASQPLMMSSEASTPSMLAVANANKMSE